MHRTCTEKPRRYIIYPFELAFKGCFKPNCYSVCLFFLGTASWLDSVGMLQTHDQHDKSKETSAQTASKFETRFFVMSQAFPRRCVHFFGKHGTTGCWFQPPWKILNILDHDPKCAGGNEGEQDLWNQQPSKQLTGPAVPFWNRWVSFFCLSSTVMWNYARRENAPLLLLAKLPIIEISGSRKKNLQTRKMLCTTWPDTFVSRNSLCAFNLSRQRVVVWLRHHLLRGRHRRCRRCRHRRHRRHRVLHIRWRLPRIQCGVISLDGPLTCDLVFHKELVEKNAIHPEWCRYHVKIVIDTMWSV